VYRWDDGLGFFPLSVYRISEFVKGAFRASVTGPRRTGTSVNRKVKSCLTNKATGVWKFTRI